jgi:HK97 family phage major capsid protein
MKHSDNLKQERFSLMTELRELPNSGLEARAMETREKELSDEIHKLSGQILEQERKENEAKERASKSGTVISKNQNDLDRYSFTRAIRVALGIDKNDGIESEMHEEARREMSAFGGIRGFGIPSIVLNRASSGQNYTTEGDGGHLVGTNGMRFFEALRNRLTLTKLGATFLTGLQGQVPLVGGGTFSASWVGEGSEISKTKAAFTDRGNISPNRVGSLGAISKELIYMSSPDIEAIILRELVDSIAQAIEEAAINGSGEGAEPTGILNTLGIGSVALGTHGANPSWDKIVELETTVNQANGKGQKNGYLTNPSVIGKLKTTVKTDTEEFIMSGNTLNGYTVEDTNAVPSDLDKGTSTGVCSAIIFGAWEHLLIGQWGGLDLIVDPYSRKQWGEIELNTNQYMDIAVSNPSRFAAIKDALTT